MGQLENESGWVAARDARDAERVRLVKQRLEALKPVTDELRAAGYDVATPDDLHRPYLTAVPILLRHLHLSTYDDGSRAVIAGALAVPEARSAWRDLVDLYRHTDPADYELKEALAEAVATTAHRAVTDELTDLLFDTALGPTRILFLRAVTRLRLPNAWPLISRALADSDLHEEAAHMLHQRDLRTARRPRSN